MYAKRRVEAVWVVVFRKGQCLPLLFSPGAVDSTERIMVLNQDLDELNVQGCFSTGLEQQPASILHPFWIRLETPGFTAWVFYTGAVCYSSSFRHIITGVSTQEKGDRIVTEEEA